MRFVLYDDETVEPITVVSVPGVGDRDIERLGRRLILAPVPCAQLTLRDGGGPEPEKLSFVEVRFEQFARRGFLVWMAFTRQVELAMLIEPDFLPGQRAEVGRLRQRADSIADLFRYALSR
jgi:hypothetical protein